MLHFTKKYILVPKMAEAQLNKLSVNEDDDFVDPWTVAGKSETGIDYEKLISKYTFTLILQYYLVSTNY